MCEKMCEQETLRDGVFTSKQDSSKEEDEKCETNWYQAVDVISLTLYGI